MGNGLDFGGRANGIIGGEAALGVDQMRGEDGVDQSRFSQTGLS